VDLPLPDPALEVAKAENFCSTCFNPHCGHCGGSGVRVKTSFSKT
jgi:hypothetical protein